MRVYEKTQLLPISFVHFCMHLFYRRRWIRHCQQGSNGNPFAFDTARRIHPPCIFCCAYNINLCSLIYLINHFPRNQYIETILYHTPFTSEKSSQVGPALTKELAPRRSFCTLRLPRAVHSPLQQHNGVFLAYPEGAAQWHQANQTQHTDTYHTRTHSKAHYAFTYVFCSLSNIFGCLFQRSNMWWLSWSLHAYRHVNVKHQAGA